MYIAHIKEDSDEIQTIKEHSENTARMCFEMSIPKLKDVMYSIGIMHDIGKYQNAFQERIRGKNIKVEHSTCGAKVANENYSDALAYLMMYCIMGHHGGIPNGGDIKCKITTSSTLHSRLNRDFEDYSTYKKELELPEININSFNSFVLEDCKDRNQLIDKFAFLTRYCFSCLVDSDTLDTRSFCTGEENQVLGSDFNECLKKIDNVLNSFIPKTKLQKARSELQKQVYENINKDSEIYILDMPTGSGKTLCSMKFALERAIKTGKKRIIYVIPYNSIIDQTCDVFENIFGESAQILRHQSTFYFDDSVEKDEDYRKTVMFATENWNSQIIVTTSVQFFESIYSNKKRKLRKLHNMSDSVIVFDEVHTLPSEYLQPCLEAVSYLSKYLNSEAVFLTATMPDFEHLIKEYVFSNVKIEHLVKDKSLFSVFEKCEYENIGFKSSEYIIEKAKEYPSSLIVVNKRSSARNLYEMCSGKKYHLSTYMTSFDRSRVINEIRKELKNLERDYPGLLNVPDDRKITVVSTSLIEAGVDLDFYSVFRQISGVDNILQAGGRCNREGKRDNGKVYIFEFEEEKTKIKYDIRPEITKGILNKYENINSLESIEEYYKKLFFIKEKDITKNSIYQNVSDIRSIPFEEYSNKFKIIKDESVSIFVPCDKQSEEMFKEIEEGISVNMKKVQKYTCSVYKYEFDTLLSQNIINDFGSGIYCLTNPDYYDKNIGVLFEAKDYII